MTGLQEAFYIIAIIYMGLSLLIIIGVLVALGIIRKKIVSLENTIHEKVEMITSMGERAGDVINTVRKFTKRKSK